jgi:predicted Zn finger-like uncharacterized protein
MIEIVCPSCEAHYQLPEGSVGSQGRKVSCSNCSHKWRAYPVGQEPDEELSQEGYEVDHSRESIRESVNGSGAGYPSEPEAELESGPEQESSGRAFAASMATIASTDAGAGTAMEPPAAQGGRDEQMAAIRQMLADLKEGADAAPPSQPEAEPESASSGPAPVMRKRADEEADDDRDPLKSRIDHLTKMNRAVKGEPTGSGYDTAKLRKLHEKRAKRFQRMKERRKKSGGFLTGFTLVAVVAAVMVGLYVMKPQIVTASPKMEPAMNEYVAAIDGYRIELNAATAKYKEWLTNRIEKMRSKEDGEEKAGETSGG